MANSQLPILRSVPIYNRLDRVLHIGIEPEGDCITLQPSQVCTIVPQPSEVAQELELEIACEGELISVHLSSLKAIYVDQDRVR
jgi:hypothetical protein